MRKGRACRSERDTNVFDSKASNDDVKRTYVGVFGIHVDGNVRAPTRGGEKYGHVSTYHGATSRVYRFRIRSTHNVYNIVYMAGERERVKTFL